MGICHGWFNRKDAVGDTDFAEHLRADMTPQHAEGLISVWRPTRRKLGLAAPCRPSSTS